MTSLYPRLIDTDDGTRTIPMRVLCLGVSRTGTTSMLEALRKLGYTPYFTNQEAQKNPKRDFSLWSEALRAKFCKQGEPFGRAEFDKLLGSWDTVLDVPCFLFVDELIAAYPDAKVILMVRNPDKWLKSMRETIFRFQMWNWPLVIKLDNYRGKPWWEASTLSWDAFIGVPGRRDYMSESYGELAKQQFVQHYDYVRKVVPRERLLEHSPDMGWEELCRFLGKPVPKEKYPHVNDAKSFLFWVTVYYYGEIGGAILKMGLPLLVASCIWHYL